MQAYSVEVFLPYISFSCLDDVLCFFISETAIRFDDCMTNTVIFLFLPFSFILKNNRVLSLIGLATKAGKTVSGEFSTEKSVKTGKGFLALVADDASENTKKKFRNMCTYYEVPLYFLSDKESLGRAMGKEFRASLAVQDENFAKAIMKALEKTNPADNLHDTGVCKEV